jgi:GT2 family glycosyltransferase
MKTLSPAHEHRTKAIDLTVVIVNYHSLRLLEACLETWSRAVDGMRAELVVVENGTGEPVAERLEALLPEARVILLEKSVGFAAAVNRGLQRASGRHVAILNPDTLLGARSLTRLVRYLDQHPDTGIVGPRVWDDPEHTSIQRSWRRFPGISTALFHRYSFLSRCWPSNPWTSAYLNKDKPADRIQETDWVSGCCMVIRGTLMRLLGGLDADYPMFCEDVDLCRSCSVAGMSVVYVPVAEIVHLIGGSRRRVRLRSLWMRHRSMTHYVLKWRSRGHPLAWIVVLGVWMRFAAQSLLGARSG